MDPKLAQERHISELYVELYGIVGVLDEQIGIFNTSPEVSIVTPSEIEAMKQGLVCSMQVYEKAAAANGQAQFHLSQYGPNDELEKKLRLGEGLFGLAQAIIIGTFEATTNGELKIRPEGMHPFAEQLLEK
ncbi:hypothetical protein ACFL1B_04205 [Nanoarchaeota archaeon]